jgi:hypothetical protein
MTPDAVCLFEEGSEPRPVIRIILALAASKEHGVYFPLQPVRRHHDPFTSFDIWCAGVSQKTFNNVESDLTSYKLLLDHSLRLRNVFNVEEVNDGQLDALTKKLRKNQKRRLTISQGDEEDEHMEE